MASEMAAMNALKSPAAAIGAIFSAGTTLATRGCAIAGVDEAIAAAAFGAAPTTCAVAADAEQLRKRVRCSRVPVGRHTSHEGDERRDGKCGKREALRRC